MKNFNWDAPVTWKDYGYMCLIGTVLSILYTIVYLGIVYSDDIGWYIDDLKAKFKNRLKKVEGK